MDADAFLTASYARIRASAAVPAGTYAPTLPSASALATARSALPAASEEEEEAHLQGIGAEATLAHLTETVAPALEGHNRGGRYFGFVTGSALPVAEAADNLVSAFDNSVQVHLPDQSIATEVEDAALRLLLRLLDLGTGWRGRTFTTGATASNILGLACGREAVVGARLPPQVRERGGGGVGELGILAACAAAGVREVQVLTSMGHSSLSKAASVVGLGRHAVKELPHNGAEPWRLDLHAVERELQRRDIASIIAVSAGEVNTGRFATSGAEDLRRLRGLADKYGAWIHVDGAFGIFARALPATDEFARLRESAAGLELADSITVDGHKLLNVVSCDFMPLYSFIHFPTPLSFLPLSKFQPTKLTKISLAPKHSPTTPAYSSRANPRRCTPYSRTRTQCTFPLPAPPRSRAPSTSGSRTRGGSARCPCTPY